MSRKNRKISILGTGNVGASIAYTLAQQGVCSEILLVDINKDKAEGEALDLAQCASCIPSVKIWSGEYEDVAGSDIVIVTFGMARKPGQTRLDLAKINVGILTSVMPNLAKIEPNALYIIVSNPVDVLTYATIKCTNLPANRVIGTGTLLDSNRLNQAIADYCKVDVHNVSSYVLGEHGDACMCPWSLATVAGQNFKDYCKNVMGVSEDAIDEECKAIYEGMVQSGATVIKKKGATYYAIAASVGKLVKAILSDSNAVIPVSTLLNGEYGANNMCIGVPCVINSNGIERIVNFTLTEDEKKLMDEKVASMDNTYNALGIRE